MYPLVDTHAHLDEIEDVDAALSDAAANGVAAVVCVGSGYESNKKVLALARAHEGLVYPALGFHPWNLNEDVERNLAFIEDNIDGVAAVGEIGLDYHKRVRERADKAKQKAALAALLSIARKHHKPVSIHSRYAWRDALDMVAESGVEGVVFHWYTGTSGVLRDIVERGYYLSATPAVEYHSEHRRAVKEVPLERLVLETDSPVVYLRGTDAEYESRPQHVLRVLSVVARIRDIEEEEVAAKTTANAVRLFGLDI